MVELREDEYVLTSRTVTFHNRPSSAWVIVDGRVYDVTLFLESHPGGSAVLEKYLGTDVSELMRGGGDVDADAAHFHSSYAYKLLQQYEVGRVADAQQDADGRPTNVPLDGNIDPATGKPLVDWSQPVLPQVGALGDKYYRWIHSFPTSDHTVKLFPNDTIESLTKCPWYVPLLFWVPVIALNMALYVYHVGFDAGSLAAYGFSGYILWLLFEYSLHRFVFHHKTTSYFGNIFHFLIHGHHHITPLDFDRLVFPPVPALLVGGPIWAAVPSLVGFRIGYAILLGFVIGYLSYDMTHFWIHYGVPRDPFLKMQKRRHVHHHYLQPDVNFGISNPLFDYVFRTGYSTG